MGSSEVNMHILGIIRCTGELDIRGTSLALEVLKCVEEC